MCCVIISHLSWDTRRVACQKCAQQIWHDVFDALWSLCLNLWVELPWPLGLLVACLLLMTSGFTDFWWNIWMELTCTVRNVLKCLAPSFMLASNLRHDVKVWCHVHLHAKTSSHGNHTLSQVVSPRTHLLSEDTTSRAWSPHVKAWPWLRSTCNMRDEMQTRLGMPSETNH